MKSSAKSLFDVKSASFEMLTREEKLKRARTHIFSTGVQDSASILCTENMKYGLAKLQHVQYELGLNPNATFIAAPDATVTRNLRRWQNGFGYGGKISWGVGNDKLIFLDSMPNACGMLVGGLEELPSMEQMIKGVQKINSKEDTIDGVPIKWDFAAGNHFIDVFEFKPLTLDYNLPFKYAFIIHGSVPELKGDNDFTKHGFGLYHHESKLLQETAETIKTPFGPANILSGDDAKNYLDLYNFASLISKKKRLRAAEHFFDEFTEITNPIHQGLINMNEVILGSQDTKDPSSKGLFPLALRADLPAYLVHGNENFNEDTIELMGFNRRAERYNVKERLLNANILPHGGGYVFPHVLDLKHIIEDSKGLRYFVTEMTTIDETEYVFTTPRELQFSYRGRQVVSRTLELGLGTVVARLDPKFVLKV
ncbi:MAG: hypothetical protein ACXAEU_23245 [Candidatus Hodarchaeales archaeon]|jgi:hypothetical protein